MSLQKSSLGCLVLLTASIALSGCTQENASDNTAEQKTMATLNTQVSYLDRSMLPPGSVMTVKLSDVSKMDVKSDVISEQTLELNGGPPYDVSLQYDKSEIKAGHRYSVSARIENQGKLLYISTTSNNPFAQQQTDQPYKVIVSKAAAAKPDVTLTNTYWKAVNFNGEAIEVKTKEPFIQFKADGTTHGFLGCNNFTGSYEANEKTITFKPLASTQKMCIEQMNIETTMSAVLDTASEFAIDGETLTMKNAAGKVTATFQATYFN
ncbi:MAG: META domain-containing protein [Pseudoalteromonas sp.]